MAQIAQKRLDGVIIGNVEEISLKDYFPPNYFDCIIYADILEHLRNPWSVLRNVTEFVSDDGIIIASIPNIRHYATIFNLLFRGYWPYRERGIHDINHLRFFTLQNIKEMFQSAKLKIIRIERKYRIIERSHLFNRFSIYFALPFIKDLIAFQYLVVAKKA